MFVTSSTKKHGWKWGNEIPSHIVSSTNRYQNSFHTSNDKYYANINERLSNVQQNCSIYMLGNYSFDTLLVILHQNLYLLNEKSRVKIRDWITRLYCFTKKIVIKTSYHTSNAKFGANKRLSNVQINCSIHMHRKLIIW